jgi:hypothetical protein
VLDLVPQLAAEAQVPMQRILEIEDQTATQVLEVLAMKYAT